MLTYLNGGIDEVAVCLNPPRNRDEMLTLAEMFSLTRV
jgi:hypothetical protein